RRTLVEAEKRHLRKAIATRNRNQALHKLYTSTTSVAPQEQHAVQLLHYRPRIVVDAPQFHALCHDAVNDRLSVTDKRRLERLMRFGTPRALFNLVSAF